jgi:RNA polymerase sigma factor (sigma-70 family)
MATGQVNRILHSLRRLAEGRGLAGQTDGQLLDGFISRRDESAFEELLRRHGPMVLGVCRRVLGHVHDAEDAFQATFMVLVRKARSVVPRDLVGHWLYGVAYRVALQAQAKGSRRRAREKQVSNMPHPTTPAPEPAGELGALLDLELSRLPEKYRVPVVLCDLEGRPRRAAARQMGVPEGTLSSRLAAARKLLARRLARHGLAVSGPALAAALAGGATQAGVPPALALSTAKAAAAGAAADAVALGLLSARAAALTEGVIKMMLISKLKAIGAVLVALGMLSSGAGLMTLTADEPRPGTPVAQAKKVNVAQPAVTPNLAPPADRFVLLADFDDEEAQGGKLLRIDGGDATGDHLALLHSGALRKFVNCRVCHAEHPGPPADPKAKAKQADRVIELLWQALDPNAGPAPGAAPLGIVNWRSGQNDLRWHYVVPKQKVTAQVHDQDVIIIRLPKKGGAAADREFLRRVCLDLAGRTPTPLEMHYFLEDKDAQKHYRIVEKLIGPSGTGAEGGRLLLLVPANSDDRAARAEAYVKEKLGKKELTAAEKQLLQKALEFAEKEQPGAASGLEWQAEWFLPKAVQPKKK